MENFCVCVFLWYCERENWGFWGFFYICNFLFEDMQCTFYIQTHTHTHTWYIWKFYHMGCSRRMSDKKQYEKEKLFLSAGKCEYFSKFVKWKVKTPRFFTVMKMKIFGGSVCVCVCLGKCGKFLCISQIHHLCQKSCK